MSESKETLHEYADFPYEYAVCAPRADCPKREQCLRASAYEGVLARGLQNIMVINPLIPVSEQGCKAFADNTPVLFAHGITHLYDELPHHAVQSLKHHLLAYFGKTTYYRIYRKERYITVREQAYIRDSFVRAGFSPDLIRYDAMARVYDLQSTMVKND